MNSRPTLVVLAVAALFLVGLAVVVYQQVGKGGRPVSYTLKLTGSSMQPDTITAHQGDRLTITITADKAEEIHLHGYDVHFEVPQAGGSVTQTFTADKTGDFEIEIEQSSTPVGHLQVSP